MRIEAEGGGWHADAVGSARDPSASEQHGRHRARGEHSSGNSIRNSGRPEEGVWSASSLAEPEEAAAASGTWGHGAARARAPRP
jgi:hypothetical protein